MQTFIPLPDFRETARVLDWRRLGKQRVECLQLLNVNLNPSSSKRGWVNHPAARMWRGHETWLLLYACDICDEWIKRGYRDTLLTRFLAMAKGRPDDPVPPWFGDPAFHASHRSNLLRKDPSWYSQFSWSEPADLPYIWPV